MIVRFVVPYGLLALLVLAPLPLGANRPWSWSLLCVLVSLLMALWIGATALSKDGPPVSIRLIAVPAFLFLGVCLFIAFQAVPGMPETLRSSYWSLLADSAGGTPATISASPYETLTALMRLLAYGCVFWLALQSHRSNEQARRTVFVLAIAAAAYSAYGLFIQFSESRSILWYSKWAYETFVTSTFVNRNSFATFAGLGVLCSISSFVIALHPASSGARDQGVWYRQVIAAISRMGLPGYASVAAIVVNATALFWSASRAGVASTIIATLVFVLCIGVRKRSSWRFSWALPVLFVGVVVGLFQVSGAQLENRLDWFVMSGGLGGDQRAEAYRQTVQGIGDNALLGTGYGTYADVFKSYRTANIAAYFDKAHNTYLELAFELGLFASAMLVAAAMLLTLRCLAGSRRHSGQYVFPWLGFCASVLVGTHALLDFSLQIPAVAVIYAALLGIGCAQSWSRQSDTRTPSQV